MIGQSEDSYNSTTKCSHANLPGSCETLLSLECIVAPHSHCTVCSTSQQQAILHLIQLMQEGHAGGLPLCFAALPCHLPCNNNLFYVFYSFTSFTFFVESIHFLVRPVCLLKPMCNGVGSSPVLCMYLTPGQVKCQLPKCSPPGEEARGPMQSARVRHHVPRCIVHQKSWRLGTREGTASACQQSWFL